MAYGFGFGFKLRTSSGPVESAPLPPDPAPEGSITFDADTTRFDSTALTWDATESPTPSPGAASSFDSTDPTFDLLTSTFDLA